MKTIIYPIHMDVSESYAMLPDNKFRKMFFENDLKENEDLKCFLNKWKINKELYLNIHIETNIVYDNFVGVFYPRNKVDKYILFPFYEYDCITKQFTTYWMAYEGDTSDYYVFLEGINHFLCSLKKILDNAYKTYSSSFLIELHLYYNIPSFYLEERIKGD